MYMLTNTSNAWWLRCATRQQKAAAAQSENTEQEPAPAQACNSTSTAHAAHKCAALSSVMAADEAAHLRREEEPGCTADDPSQCEACPEATA